jgi:hypothetical protein
MTSCEAAAASLLRQFPRRAQEMPCERVRLRPTVGRLICRSRPMKIIHSLLLLSGPALASAQVAPPIETACQGGLLGHNYSGIELGYVRHHQGPPRVMRRYGFVARRRIPDDRDLDGIFRLNAGGAPHWQSTSMRAGRGGGLRGAAALPNAPLRPKKERAAQGRALGEEGNEPAQLFCEARKFRMFSACLSVAPASL